MKHEYDLKERTARFGERIIDFAKALVRDAVGNPLIPQVIRSATSIGANYMEADGAESKPDFRHKIALFKERSKGNLPLVTDACASTSAEDQRLPPVVAGSGGTGTNLLGNPTLIKGKTPRCCR